MCVTIFIVRVFDDHTSPYEHDNKMHGHLIHRKRACNPTPRIAGSSHRNTSLSQCDTVSNFWSQGSTTTHRALPYSATRPRHLVHRLIREATCVLRALSTESARSTTRTRTRAHVHMYVHIRKTGDQSAHDSQHMHVHARTCSHSHLHTHADTNERPKACLTEHAQDA